MGKTWALITHLHALAGPSLTLIYPLYASICAMESATRVDDEQWLAYWIIYSFITLFEMAAEHVLYWLDTAAVRGEAAAGGVAGPAALQGRVLHLRQVRQGAAEEERGESARSPPRPRRRPRAARLPG
ncbi:HVA22-like protein d [Zea mays]|uniref:HVA22-like protein n=1 Tax=Zea mays TaxID=4577 RepID=A0A1D6ERC5_MAIZE|nr:HVA22-like protein d [Zea mays]